MTVVRIEGTEIAGIRDQGREVDDDPVVEDRSYSMATDDALTGRGSRILHAHRTTL